MSLRAPVPRPYAARRQRRAAQTAHPCDLSSLSIGAPLSSAHSAILPNLVEPGDLFRPRRRYGNSTVADYLSRIEDEYTVAGVAPSELFDEGAILTATLDSSKKFTPMNALVDDILEFDADILEYEASRTKGALPPTGQWIVRELMKAAWRDLDDLPELKRDNGQTFHSQIERGQRERREQRGYWVETQTAYVVGGSIFPGGGFHDDAISGLNVIFSFSESSSRPNPRIGTRFRREEGGGVYQHAGPSSGRAVTVQVFPANSTVFDHAAPIMEAVSERYSFFVHLPIEHGHTPENTGLYAAAAQHVMGRIQAWGEMTVPQLRAEHEKVRTTGPVLFSSWRWGHEDDVDSDDDVNSGDEDGEEYALQPRREEEQREEL